MQKTSKPKPINWIAVRAEYEAGGVSLRQLADKLGVNRSTLERRSSKEGWAKNAGKLQADVKAKVQAKVREEIIDKRVKKALTDLDMINNVIALTYDAILGNPDNFKTTGEAIAALDRMQKIKFEYSQERIEKWLFDKGYVAVPISELATASKDQTSERIESGLNSIPLDTIVARASEIESTIIPTAQRDLGILLSGETGSSIQNT